LSKGKGEGKEKDVIRRIASLCTQESEEELRKKFKRRLISASSLILADKKN